LLQYLENIKALKKGQKHPSHDSVDESKDAGTDAETSSLEEAQESSLAMDEDKEPEDSADAEENRTDAEGPVQVFVTSHSPNFASIAKLASLVCLVEADEGTKCFLPSSVVFDKGKREKRGCCRATQRRMSIQLTSRRDGSTMQATSAGIRVGSSLARSSVAKTSDLKRLKRTSIESTFAIWKSASSMPTT